jgi:DNA polymerase III subunit beta
MKFITSSTTLLKHLQQISGVLTTNNTLPILDHFLFDIKEGVLKVSASDLDTTMTATLNIEAQENGMIAIPAKLLLETLKSFADQPLTFTLNEDLSIEISSDYGKYKLTGQDASEFPKSPEKFGVSKINLNSFVLANAINKSIFATGNDDLRPVMSGVFCEIDKSHTTFVATDAHKLVRYRRLDTVADEASSFILPKKPLNLLKNLLSIDETNVTIDYNNTNAFFEFNNIFLSCRLIEGKYPNYEAVIPKENPNVLTIARTPFLSSIKRVSIFSNKTTNQVRFKITGNSIQISAEDTDYSNEAVEVLACEYSGEDLEIGFNSRFIVEMLSNMDSDSITLKMSAPNRAGILSQTDSDEPNEDLLMLVMPIMLNN